jgi:hypothetical protein
MFKDSVPDRHNIRQWARDEAAKAAEEFASGSLKLVDEVPAELLDILQNIELTPLYAEYSASAYWGKTQMKIQIPVVPDEI